MIHYGLPAPEIIKSSLLSESTKSESSLFLEQFQKGSPMCLQSVKLGIFTITRSPIQHLFKPFEIYFTIIRPVNLPFFLQSLTMN